MIKYMQKYYVPSGGMPDKGASTVSKAIFTESYIVIPASSLTDIVTSNFPFWERSRFWVLARPLSGFAETFSQYIAEVFPGGGSETPDIVFEGEIHRLEKGGFSYLPPGTHWKIRNLSESVARFHWIRKAYNMVDGLEVPEALFTKERDLKSIPMEGYEDSWLTTRFIDIADLRYDMNIAIVSFMPGGRIPFMETHVMEHGLYVLQGRAVYCLNNDWVEVSEGDFMWLRAFCPQACYAGGPEVFRYLLYKDVNRHAHL
jgi:(S)-ureidoglycine aminohydrolase